MSNLAIPLGLYDMDYDHVMREGKVITKPADTSNTPLSTDATIDLFATAASPLDAVLASICESPLLNNGKLVTADGSSIADDTQIPGYLLSAQENSTNKALRLRTQHYLKPGETVVPAKGAGIHIGIDSEYVYNPKTMHNDILSYQFFVKTEKGEHAEVIYPASSKKSDRLSFERFISHIIIECKAKGLITEWPKHVFVYAHFLRADLASFGDFWRFKTQLNGIRRTVASVNNAYGIDLENILHRQAKPAPLILRDKQRKAQRTFVTFVDTMLHTPGGAGLAAVGELIGLPKLSLPAGHSIDRMDELLAGNKAAFEAYALRDAEIAVKYGLQLHAFAKTLGLSSLPKTIGSCATSVFLKHLRETGQDRDLLFGTHEVVQTGWSKNASRPVTKKAREMAPEAKLFEGFAIDCYHGGRNECFWDGPTPLSLFNDFDLSGAYTTGLVDLFPLDYERGRMTTNTADFCGHVFGLARVKYRFPDGTRYPSLPVRTEIGLLFPLTGESFCTAPEIEVALRMGCQIEIYQGVIIPWADTPLRLFEPFVSQVREKRQSYVKKSFEELLWKEIGNSLYGKLAQGLRGKSAFDTSSGLSKPIERSAITNAFFAAHTTGLIRAVLGEVLASIPAHRTVVSVTTDGFLTDATYDELVLTGPICRRFQELGERLDGPGFRMLEQKHQVKQVIAMKTRGQLTPEGVEGQPQILAKAGVKPPCSKDQHQAYMLDLYLNRTPGQKVESDHLISTAEMWINERDLVSVSRSKTLNLEFDFKRQPMLPSMQHVLGTEHICFDTRPWPTVAAAMEQRVVFDNWRRTNCLKTLDDWESWEDYFACKASIKGLPMRMTDEGSLGILKRVFLRAYTQSAFGMTKTMGYDELAEWLTVNGCPTSVDDCKSAKRAKLVGQCVPVTTRTVRLMRAILQECPGIELGALFKPEDILLLQDRLNRAKAGMAQITLDAQSHEVITD